MDVLHSGPAPDEALAGTIVDHRYEVVELLGVGRGGPSYRVEHVRTGRRLRLRALPGAPALQNAALYRLERSAVAGASIVHPAVVAVIDLGELYDGRPYLVLEDVEGRTLAEELEAGRLAPTRAIGIARQLADALVAVHRADVVHREVGPRCVLLTRPGARADQVRLVGFGGASVPRTTSVSEAWRQEAGIRLGSDGYRAPELAPGATAQVDHRADLWSFGALLHAMLLGEPPSFAALADPSQLASGLERVVSRQLAQMVCELLASDAAVRPSSAEEVLHALDELREPTRPEGAGGAVVRGTSGLVGSGAAGAPAALGAPEAELALADAVPRAARSPRALPGAGVPISTAELRSASQRALSLRPSSARQRLARLRGSLGAPGTPAGASIAAVGRVAEPLRGALRGVGLRVLRAPLAVRVGVAVVLCALVAVVLVFWLTRKPAEPERAEVATPSRVVATPRAASAPPAAVTALLADARLGKKDALTALADKAASDPSGEAWLALAEGRKKAGDPKGALDALSRLLRDKPETAEHAVVRRELPALVKVPHITPLVLDVMASMRGPEGPDLLFDLWASTSERNPVTGGAKEALLTDDVRKKASPALLIALDLRLHKNECDVIKPLVARAPKEADSRALRPLLVMTSKQGCGRSGDGDCFPCLRADDSLQRAVEATKSRKAPDYVGSLLPTQP